jgi:hypothetical protein
MFIACAISAQRLLLDKWAFNVALFANFLLAEKSSMGKSYYTRIGADSISKSRRGQIDERFSNLGKGSIAIIVIFPRTSCSQRLI